MAFPFAAALASFFVVAAPGPTAEQATAAVQQSVPLIEVQTLDAQMKAKSSLYILDVRQPEEFAQGHIDGAVPMPLGTVSANFATLPKGTELVVYCHSGKRSAQAVAFLRAHGYAMAVSLSGGYLAWSAAHPPRL